MTYINLPYININNFDLNFNINIDNSNNDIFLSYSLYNYLNNLKQNITQYNDKWDIFKKFTNPHEYIHGYLPHSKITINKYKPISRAYFKIIEIINTFNLLNEKNEIKSFHLAEGPGGFIEGFLNYRNNINNINNINDIYYGITLISNNSEIPSWKKNNNLFSNSKIKIIYGKTKDGDLFKKHNLTDLYENYHNSINYVTGDGGFDFSKDFNNQENISYKLILTQIFCALLIQKKNGYFILKIFDIFKYKTVEIIFLLSIFYENVYIYKPKTSRIANSEKYIICKNFKGINIKFIQEILNNFENIIINTNNLYSLFNFNIPLLYLSKLQEINAIYGQQQLENINYTINLIREFENLNNKYNLIKKDSNILSKYININDNFQNKILSNRLFLFNSDEEELDINLSIKNIISNNNINSKKIQSENEEIDIYFNKINTLLTINVIKCINWIKKFNLIVK